ncbi:MAG: ABC transporter permease [Chloroflexi bacterium]|nr:ABC transporter permease [Chloroflexota bacterium]
MRRRIASIIIKEFIELKRDRRTFAIVIFMPLVQLLIFGYALSTDVKHIPTVVWDASNTPQSRSFLDSFRQTEFFDVAFYASNYEEINRRVDSGEARAALVIPADYARKLERREPAQVQFFVDGSEPTSGQQALFYASMIAQAKNSEIMTSRLNRPFEPPVKLEPRVWYNPSMEAVAFNIPGLIGVVLQMMTTLLTAFAIVREREMGTMEQLITSPLKPWELIVGKLVPYILVAYADVIMILAAAVLVFKVPVHGNIFLLLALTSVFLMYSLGIGILVSSVSRNQFQAYQLAWAPQIPAVLLSGFFFPVEAMPRLAQAISYLIPLTYFLHMIRGILLKGVGLEYLWRDVAVLGVVGSLTLVFAITRLRKTLD